MGELEQQEKLFLTQATHVNAWNKLLIENADKVSLEIACILICNVFQYCVILFFSL